jgi:esterase/lipase superfamily enzyme
MKSVLRSILLIVIFVSCSAARAQDGDQHKFVSIPLLYITDRAATAKGAFGPQRKVEEGTSIYRLNCGTVNCSVRNTREKQLEERHKQMVWSGLDKAAPISTKPIPGSGTDDAYQLFGNFIEETASNSGTKEVFVIVHGFNTTFAEAAASAAKLAYNVERPVIVFDWPSKGRLTQYGVDAGNNEWSQEHFDRFLEELKAVKDRSGIKFNLLAHSMGNRLVVRSAPVLRSKHLFDQMYLVDPDFDAETFVHYLVRYGRNPDNPNTADGGTADPTRIRILFSHRDRALPFAQCLFGGYTRLGQAADTMLATIFSPLSTLENITRTAPMDDVKEKVESAEKDLDWLVKFDWIDFTALDHGLIGHTIPFELISNLWSSDLPGNGLELIEASNSSPNKLSRLFLSLFREKAHISSRLGTCKRVAFKRDADRKLAVSTQSD